MQLSRLLAASAVAASAAAADDLIIADFEGDQYAPWTVSGEAFGKAPAVGPLPGQMNVEGFRGKGLVKSRKPGDRNPLDAIRAELVEVRVEFEPGDAKEVVFNIRDIMVEYGVAKQEISVAGHRAPAPLRDGRQRLVIYCDRTGAEVFASDGLCYVPMPFNTKPENIRLYFETRGGTARVNALEVHELPSAWTVQ